MSQHGNSSSPPTIERDNTFIATMSNGLSRSSAEFLLGLLNQQQVQVGAPGFDEAIANVMTARKELQKIIDNHA